MLKKDWFRNKTWNASIEADFNERLRRARDKAQYLRIQASYLSIVEPEVALSLLTRYFALGEHFDIAQAYLDQSRAFATLGDKKASLGALRAALERERTFPNVRTVAWREFTQRVLMDERLDDYDELESLLNDRPLESHLFPVDKFCWLAGQALLMHFKGCYAEAKQLALLAITWSAVKESGMRFHPHIGLFEQELKPLKDKLQLRVLREASTARYSS